MTRSVISIGIGQCGIQSLAAVWRLYCAEHEIELDGTLNEDNGCDAHKTFFEENTAGILRARSLLLDLEDVVCDTIRSSDLKAIFDNESIINGFESGANLYPMAFHRLSKTILNRSREQLRLTLERSDFTSGMLIYNSIEGGTGSGFTSRFLAEIDDDCNDLDLSRVNFAIHPSAKISCSTTAPYNAAFYLHETVATQNVELSIVLDNEALYNAIPFADCTYADINQLTAQLSSSLTASMRFDDQLAFNIRDLRTNLVPWPTLNNLIANFAPLTASKADKPSTSCDSITFSCFHTGRELATLNSLKGTYIGCSLNYRGLVLPRDVNVSVQKLKSTFDNFAFWVPTGFKIGICNKKMVCPQNCPFIPVSKSVSKFANNSAIGGYFGKALDRFRLLFSMYSFVFWYQMNGFEEADFNSADESLCNIIETYKEIGNSSE